MFRCCNESLIRIILNPSPQKGQLNDFLLHIQVAGSVQKRDVGLTSWLINSLWTALAESYTSKRARLKVFVCPKYHSEASSNKVNFFRLSPRNTGARSVQAEDIQGPTLTSSVEIIARHNHYWREYHDQSYLR